MRACPYCNVNTEFTLIDEFPAEVLARAAQLKLTPEQHAKENLSHVSFTVVKFVEHKAPGCDCVCIGSYTPEQRRSLPNTLRHDGFQPCGCEK
jgi:hypothetical protein